MTGFQWEPCAATSDGCKRWVAVTQGAQSITLTVRVDTPSGTVYEQTRARWNGPRGQGRLW